MRNHIRVMPLLIFMAVLTVVGKPSIADRPNILLIFLDDFGWKDTGYMGSDFYETPNIDNLAQLGMVFTDAYAGAANCAPSRACLLSGQYTPRHEIYNVGTGARGKAEHRRLLHVPGVKTLNPEIRTWAQQLQSAGYETATMGKWHLSDDPMPYGFDLNIGGTHAGGPPKGYYPPHGNVPNLQNAPAGEYITDRLSDEAVKFIRTNKDRPWLLYLTHFAVHTPLHAKRELVAKYASKPPGSLHHHVPMATMIQAVDDGVGKIIATLEELDIRDNTVIMFYSDNGGYGPATDMDPLTGYKGTYYEGGIRVPFFVNWPGVVNPGSKSAEPITGVDIYPTLCEIAGTELPEIQPLDGVSLVGLFKGDVQNLDTNEGPRSIYWHFPAYLQAYQVWDEQRDPLFRSRPCGIIRKGKWKLHEYFESGDLELFNLETDIGESKNLHETYEDKTNELLADMENWRRRINAPVPQAANPKFDSDAESRAIQAMNYRQPGKRRKRKLK